jgi:D-alanyl-lipoteichoic acid acyltransferase DltB (MBOAT superfamily)
VSIDKGVLALKAGGAIALGMAALGFAIQVYGDFSGYSDIARGSSRLLGVELRRNFEQPFLSRDIQEFWLRWHTSLSSWFTDFVAVPLGTRYRGPRARIGITLVVFGLSGLWHGASWNFVVWGLLNGVLVAARRRPPARAGKDAYRVRWSDAPRIGLTIATFSLGAVFFRAASLDDAFTMLERIVTLTGGSRPPATALLVPVMLVVVLALDVLERHQRIAGIAAFGSRTAIGSVAKPAEVVEESVLAGGRSIPAGLLVGAMVLAVVVFSGGTSTPFIYFQF